ncbi:MAG TPA: sigma-70 family RNA polymerase sigma factor [Terriglobia bacterium]|nr:sigma-70 family RNA polymerase sigma factor [Terriglobia bacterium]
MSKVPGNAEPRATDLELIRRVAEGDEPALARLYDRYSGIVYSVAHRVLQDSGAAEEVLQDIFYQLWCTAANYDASRGGLGGWLLVSARNRAIDRLRRRKPATTTEDERIALPGNLESEVAQTELILKVKSALDILAAPQRQALELAYFEGMTHSEIAERTGQPLGTVKTRLRAALETLRQVLNP